MLLRRFNKNNKKKTNKTLACWALFDIALYEGSQIVWLAWYTVEQNIFKFRFASGSRMPKVNLGSGILEIIYHCVYNLEWSSFPPLQAFFFKL